jgi:hypothetical protein
MRLRRSWTHARALLALIPLLIMLHSAFRLQRFFDNVKVLTANDSHGDSSGGAASSVASSDDDEEEERIEFVWTEDRSGAFPRLTADDATGGEAKYTERQWRVGLWGFVPNSSLMKSDTPPTGKLLHFHAGYTFASLLTCNHIQLSCCHAAQFATIDPASGLINATRCLAHFSNKPAVLAFGLDNKPATMHLHGHGYPWPGGINETALRKVSGGKIVSKTEIAYAQCHLTRNKTRFQHEGGINYLLRVIKDEALAKRQRARLRKLFGAGADGGKGGASRRMPNVHIIILDSLSRFTALDRLPETMTFLEQLGRDARAAARIFQFPLFSQQGPGTLGNLPELLAGCDFTRDFHCKGHYPLPNVYADAGYVTAAGLVMDVYGRYAGNGPLTAHHRVCVNEDFRSVGGKNPRTQFNGEVDMHSRKRTEKFIRFDANQPSTRA